METIPTIKRQVSHKPFQSKTSLLIAILVLSFLIRLYYSWQPLPQLLDQGIADDAFYYLTIARNIALGRGITFDGINPTNGFHPLYTFILVPIFILNPDRLYLNAQLGLTLLMAFNVLTAIPLYKMIDITYGGKAGLIAVVFWLFNPWNLIFSLGGVESAIYIFFIALSSYFYVKYQQKKRTNSATSHATILGISLGLTILARSDGVFLLIAILIDRLSDWLSRKSQASPTSEFRHLLIIFGLCAAVLLPWLLWNLLTFNEIIQVSGRAIYWHTHFGNIATIGQMVPELLSSFSRMLFGTIYFTIQTGLLVLLIGVFALVKIYHQKKSERWSVAHRENRKVNVSFRFLYLYAILIFLFYAIYLWQQQFWYFMPLIFVGSVLAGVLISKFESALDDNGYISPNFFIALVLALTLIVFVATWWDWQTGKILYYPEQKNGLEIAQWFQDKSPSGSKIGTWNSGIIGYLSGRTVINLDGVVNNPLYSYVSTRNVSFFDLCGIWDYVSSSQIDYITDYSGVMSKTLESGEALGLDLQHEFPSVHDSGSYIVSIFRIPDHTFKSACQSANN